MTSKSQTITDFEDDDRMPPVHPGEMLRTEFLEPLGITPQGLADALMVPANGIVELVQEKRGINGELAIRLGRYFRMSAQFWMNLQSHYELETARDSMAPGVQEAIRPAAVDASGQLLARSA